MKSFKYEAIQDSKTITKSLDALSEGVSNGNVTFGAGGEKVILNPKGLLYLKISASAIGGKYSIKLNISWKDAPVENDPEQPVINSR